jgi:lipopolysaccharide biosynthesis protein
MLNIYPIAFYLPQFHPIPENDQWWGKGFTEWANVVKARPLFNGHYQPHLPADLGFYDLRLNETLELQAKYAKENGIFGFCFYHYWFNGQRLLNAPVDNLIKEKKPSIPFMLCWANENWTRRWDGQENEVLIRQNYSIKDDIKHMEFLCQNIFKDDRYIKVYGKPVFALYRADFLPDIRRTAEIWRQTAIKAGFRDLYLLKIESGTDRSNPEEIGFDASVEFQPDWTNLPRGIKPGLVEKILNKLKIRQSSYLNNSIFKYEDLIEAALSKKIPHYKLYRCVTPSWDNSARRRSGAHIFINSTPGEYGKWLDQIISSFEPFSKEENFVFINAWNEWAEGSHLEPCLNWNDEYLKITKEIIGRYNS